MSISGACVRVALVVNAGLAAALLAQWLRAAYDGLFWQADFTMFYTGWSMVLDGQGPRLYDLGLQQTYQQHIVPERVSGVLPFNYPPHTALLVPLALLPRAAAFYLWSAIQVGLVFLLVRHIQILRGEGSKGERPLLLATLLAFPALFVTFQMGQLSLLVVVCLLGLVRALEEDRPWGAAAWFILGTIKPQLMVIPAILLLAGRRWAILVRAAALFAPWAILTSCILGLHCWVDFLRLAAHSAQQVGAYGIFPERMYNLKAPVTVLLGSDHIALINTISLAAFAAGLLFAIAMGSRPWPGDRAGIRLRLALCLQLGLLTNLHFNPADALAFVVPAVLVWSALTATDPLRLPLVVLLVASPLVFLIDCYAMPSWPLGIRPFFLLMVLLAGIIARALVPATVPALSRPGIARLS